MKLKSLKIKKEKLQKELEDLEKDWSRPRANLTEEDLASMKTQYDSLSLDLKSAILTLDIEIEIKDIKNEYFSLRRPVWYHKSIKM